MKYGRLSRPMFHPSGRQQAETDVFEYWPIEKCAAMAADRLFIKSGRPLHVLKPKNKQRSCFYFGHFSVGRGHRTEM